MSITVSRLAYCLEEIRSSGECIPPDDITQYDLDVCISNGWIEETETSRTISVATHVGSHTKLPESLPKHLRVRITPKGAKLLELLRSD